MPQAPSHHRRPVELTEAAQVFSMLGEANRLRMLKCLAQRGECSVEQLRGCTQLTRPATSHHLTLLRLAGLVESRRAGQYILYRLLPGLACEVLKVVGEDAALAQLKRPRKRTGRA